MTRVPLDALTPRWRPMRAHAIQRAYWESKARFNVVPAGRRSGKTEIAKRKWINRGIAGTRFPDARFFFGAPTRDQAKRIYWGDLKALVPRWLMQRSPNETELSITLINGTEFCVIGMDKPERIEGSPWDGGVLDEFANMKERAWSFHVRPALSDREGGCDLIGVPEGRNHYYELHKYALSGADPDFASFSWKSADILSAKEIESAKRALDELSFLQEYEASFLNFTGRAYYPFSESVHCVPHLRNRYDDRQPLIICLDFNVAPGVAVICQEFPRLINGVLQPGTITACIGEVHIPRNSNTVAVCERLIADWGKHKGLVHLYGDATGGAKKSSSTEGSDWDIVESRLRPKFGSRLKDMHPNSNPTERARVNSVNTRLMNGAGEARMLVDPRWCPKTVEDFEGVSLLEGGSGEIDKDKDPKITHLSDAIGYYVASEFPIASRVVLNAGF